jgi:hypothetical protein
VVVGSQNFNYRRGTRDFSVSWGPQYSFIVIKNSNISMSTVIFMCEGLYRELKYHHFYLIESSFVRFFFCNTNTSHHGVHLDSEIRDNGKHEHNAQNCGSNSVLVRTWCLCPNHGSPFRIYSKHLHMRACHFNITSKQQEGCTYTCTWHSK